MAKINDQVNELKKVPPTTNEVSRSSALPMPLDHVEMREEERRVNEGWRAKMRGEMEKM